MRLIKKENVIVEIYNYVTIENKYSICTKYN
jgi:hypothetical protein